MTKAGYIVGSAVGGVIVGAIGGAIAYNSSGHPVLKASLGTGAIYAAIAAFVASSDLMKFEPANNTLSGPPPPLRFP